MKTFYAAEVRPADAGKEPLQYVGAMGRLVTTPHFFSSRGAKTLKHYLTRKSYGHAHYNGDKMMQRTFVVKLDVDATLHCSRFSTVRPIEFVAICEAPKKNRYSAYATFRLRKADGSWVSVGGKGGKFGKTWTTAGALRRHLGDRIHWLKKDYARAVVHVTIYDREGINVVETKQIPAMDFFLQSPIYSKKWDEINTPTTISAGSLSGRLAHSDIV